MSSRALRPPPRRSPSAPEEGSRLLSSCRRESAAASLRTGRLRKASGTGAGVLLAWCIWGWGAPESPGGASGFRCPGPGGAPGGPVLILPRKCSMVPPGMPESDERGGGPFLCESRASPVRVQPLCGKEGRKGGCLPFSRAPFLARRRPVQSRPAAEESEGEARPARSQQQPAEQEGEEESGPPQQSCSPGC